MSTDAPRSDRASVLPAGTVTFLVTEPPADDGEVRAYDSPADAVAAALEQRAAGIALHTGESRVIDGRHSGPALRRCEQLARLAGPGRILLSEQTAAGLAGVPLRDLGVHRLRDLSAPIRIFELSDDSSAGPFEPWSLDAVPNNLPVQLTGFVGRRPELAAVRSLLAEHRLVTLTGAGGCGKTRLAAQAGADQTDRWPAGVWWTELAPAGNGADADQVADAVADAAGLLVDPAQGPLRSLAGQLRDRRLLLCLDNCEHVLDGVAEVATELLRACPEVTLLVTSREPLGLPGEAVWRVPPLTTDEAMLLFVERGSLVRPWLTLDAPAQAAVRTLCERLDGMPLALELAAGWLRTLAPQQIEASLDDRFALLVRAPRGTDPRHRTLAASIDWSHALLDEPERTVFRRLAVFPAGFDLDAIRAVCAGPDDLLAIVGRLVDKSLVVAEDRDGTVRYRLLETIREYAADRLADAGEEPLARDRHLRHFLLYAEQTPADVQLQPVMDDWRPRLEREYDNLRAALDHGLSADDPEPGRRMAAALAWLWHLHHHGRDGMVALRRAIALRPDDRSPLQARLLAGLAVVADTASPLDHEYDAAERALTLATELGDERLRALCLTLAASGKYYSDPDATLTLALEAEQCGELAGDEFTVHAASGLRGIVLHLRDRNDEALPLIRAAADVLEPRHPGFAATALIHLSFGYLCTGEPVRARAAAERGMRLARTQSDYLTVGAMTARLAVVRAWAGDITDGMALMEPFRRLVDDATLADWVGRTMADLCLRAGDPAAAVRWYERSGWPVDRTLDTHGATRGGAGFASALRQLGRVDEASAVLGRTAEAAGRLVLPAVRADVLEQRALLAGDPGEAQRLHHDALAIRVEHGLRTFYPDSLDPLAALLADSGRHREAARLLSSCDRSRGELHYPRTAAQRQQHDSTVAALRSSLGDDFEDAWRSGTELGLDDAVALVRRARGARNRPATGWDSLTPTELDVVRLIVDGLANPEIGARLFISRSTVKAHLSHVYEKLGVANRTELAALATTRLPGS